MPSNHNWVCFNCHSAIRLAKRNAKSPTCNQCGGEMFCLGYKVEIPKKTERKAWAQLREDCRNRIFQEQENKLRSRVARFHTTERKIHKMESLPENPDRRKQINQLKRILSDEAE